MATAACRAPRPCSQWEGFDRWRVFDERSNAQALSSAELYDPSTAIFSMTANMGMPRAGHTATLLPDGKVLIVGGFSSVTGGGYDGGTDTAELYDPDTETFAHQADSGSPIMALCDVTQQRRSSDSRRRLPISAIGNRGTVRSFHGRIFTNREHDNTSRQPHCDTARGWQGPDRPQRRRRRWEQRRNL